MPRPAAPCTTLHRRQGLLSAVALFVLRLFLLLRFRFRLLRFRLAQVHKGRRMSLPGSQADEQRQRGDARARLQLGSEGVGKRVGHRGGLGGRELFDGVEGSAEVVDLRWREDTVQVGIQVQVEDDGGERETDVAA